MPGSLKFTFQDYSREKSNITFYTDDVTNANLDTIDTLSSALKSAIDGVTLGNINKRVLNAIDAVEDPGPSTDPLSGREAKWRLILQDSVTGEQFFPEIPCADFSGTKLQTNSDQANLSDAAWVSLKGAIDGNYNSPNTGNSLLLIGATRVGRNL